VTRRNSIIVDDGDDDAASISPSAFEAKCSVCGEKIPLDKFRYYRISDGAKLVYEHVCSPKCMNKGNPS
jgi:hypothetical protein